MANHFDEDIAQELHENPASFLNVSLDSGTAKTWYKVKGVNNFDHVIENLKKYSQSAHHPEQVSLKYIILPGINDSEEDFRAFVDFKKKWNMSLGTFSRDNRVLSDLDPSSDASLSHKVFNSNIIESAARLTAIHAKEIGSVSFSNFTEEEKHQIVNLANEILKYM